MRLLAASLLALFPALLPVLAHAADTSPEAAVAALWQSLSHPANVAADTATLERLFHPDALVLGGRYRDGKPAIAALKAADFIAGQRKPRPRGFYECEVAREVRQYDRFATVYSVVESRTERDAPAADFVGVNSIGLYRQDDGWKIVSLYYHVEKPGLPVPLAGGKSGACLGAQ